PLQFAAPCQAPYPNHWVTGSASCRCRTSTGFHISKFSQTCATRGLRLFVRLWLRPETGPWPRGDLGPDLWDQGLPVLRLVRNLFEADERSLLARSLQGQAADPSRDDPGLYRRDSPPRRAGLGLRS